MSGGGQPTSESYYLNWDRSEDSLARVDHEYCEVNDDGTSVLCPYDQERCDDLRSIWGHSDDGAFQIGTRGKIWGLCLLVGHQFLSDHFKRPLKPTGIVFEVLDLSEEERKSSKWEKDSLEKRFADLVSNRFREARHSAAEAEEILGLLLDFLQGRMQLQGQEVDLPRLVSEAHEAPSHLYRNLCDELDLNPIDVQFAKTPQRAGTKTAKGLEPWEAVEKLWNADDNLSFRDLDAKRAATLTVDMRGEASKIFRDVSMMRKKPVLYVVSGAPTSGKKGRIEEVLAKIINDCQHECLILERVFEGDKSELAQVPVLCFSAQQLGRRKLIDRVLERLERWHSLSSDGVDNFKGISAMDLDERLTRIRQLSEWYPFVYVFTDVPPFEEANSATAITSIGIRRLIPALLGRDKRTGVIVTTGVSSRPRVDEDDENQATTGAWARAFEWSDHPIAEKKVSELKRFILRPQSGNPRFLPSDLEGAIEQYKDVRVGGEALVAAAALCRLVYKEKNAWPDRLDWAQILSDTASSNVALGSDLYDRLLDWIESEGFLEVASLLVASDDGVWAGTMKKMLQEWLSCASDPVAVRIKATFCKVGETEVREDIIEDALVRLRDVCGSKFVKRVPVSRYDKYEYGLDERGHGEGQKNWVIDAPVAARLATAFVSMPDRRSTFQMANRLIAIQARRRSRFKKIFGRTSAGFGGSEDVVRDIQAYKHLLASVDPDMLDAPKAVNEAFAGGRVPHKLNEDAVFTADSAAFDPGVALRFAGLELLREEIDRGEHMLSMVDDEDELRLELYLLLFHECGAKYAPVDALTLPNALPSHMRRTTGIFSDEEVASFLSTIGVVAHHAGRSDIVEQASNILSKNFDADPAALSTPMMLNASRLHCALIDDEALHLGGLEGGDRPTSVTEVHDKVDGLIKRYFNDLDETVSKVDDFGSAGFDRLFDKIEEKNLEVGDIKSFARLMVRRAELTTILMEPSAELSQGAAANGRIANRRAGIAEYRRIEMLEGVLAERFGAMAPSILSGRTARRYIRFLWRAYDFRSLYLGPTSRFGSVTDAPKELSEEQLEVIDKMRALVHVNIDRLRRYSGTDRCLSLTDLARLRISQGRLDEAIKFSDESRALGFAGNASPAALLDVLTANVDMKLILIEDQITTGHHFGHNDNARVLGEAEDAISDIRLIAGSHTFPAFVALANFFMARVEFCKNRESEKFRRPISELHDITGHLQDALDVMRKQDNATFSLEMARFVKGAGINFIDR